MGWQRHDAIIVTCWDKQRIEEAHCFACQTCSNVSPLVGSMVNDYRSFLIAPDGSKEGWPESDQGDYERAKLLEWLDTQRYEDGSSAYNWVEVRFANDGPAIVVSEDRRA